MGVNPTLAFSQRARPDLAGSVAAKGRAGKCSARLAGLHVVLLVTDTPMLFSFSTAEETEA
jgi:hypothetical protein